MPRVTKAELEQQAAWLGQILDRDFYIRYAYGRPRLEELLASGGAEDISPRLPAGELMRWMWAFEKGIKYGTDPGYRR